MAVVERTAQHATEILIRKVDNRLIGVRAGLRGGDLELAERIASCLRALVRETASASAADRARVRAAVHSFALRRAGRPVPPARSLAATAGVVNRVVLHLGRPDLLVPDVVTRGVDGSDALGSDAAGSAAVTAEGL
nr:hypothetical protein [Micromonospora sp. DSM 115978]